MGRLLIGLLVVASILGAGFALLSGANLATAVPGALAATALAAAAAGLALGERLRWAPAEPKPLESDPAVEFREALRGGKFARQNTLAQLRALERRFRTALIPLSPEEESRVLEMGGGEFRRWLDSRVAALEAST
jgi:hypothetical protein